MNAADLERVLGEIAHQIMDHDPYMTFLWKIISDLCYRIHHRQIDRPNFGIKEI